MANQPFHIDYTPIAVPLREIPLAIFNRIDGEKRRELEGIHPALPEITKWTVRLAARTFEGATYLSAEDKTDPERRFRTAVCIPPLGRAVLDNLFSLIFLYDAPKENSRWFIASTWRDARFEYDMLLERHQADPEYDKWLSDYKSMVDALARDASITAQEHSNPKSISLWPLPSQMTDGKRKGGGDMTQDASRRCFLKYLRKWYYGSLSADAHSTGLGLARRSSLLFENIIPETLAVRLSQKFFQLLTVYVALLSEVVGELKFFHESPRLRQVWDHIILWPEAKDLLEARYDKWLPGTLISPSKDDAG